MKKTMQMNLTNRDEIAGLPALSLAEFFRQCEAPIEAEEIGTWFHLDGKEKEEAFRRLVNEGYLDLNKNRLDVEFIKTNAALEIERSAPDPALEISDVHSIVLMLLGAVSEVNSSPATAHRVRATTIIGGAIDGSLEPKALVEAVIELAPASVEVTLQGAFERLAHEYATAKGLPIQRGDDPQAASVRRIKDALLETHERASLRFVIR